MRQKKVLTITRRAGLKPQGKMIQILTRNGKDLDKLGVSQRTALYYAVLANTIVLISLLLEAGARTDKCDGDGQTPGHLAVATKKLDALNILFTQQPAAFSIRNPQSKTIYMLFEHMGLSSEDKGWKEALEIACTLEHTAYLFTKPPSDTTLEDGFQPTVVGHKSGVYTPLRQNIRPSNVLAEDRSFQELIDDDAEINWLHLPANNASPESHSLDASLQQSRKGIASPTEVETAKILGISKMLSEELWIERLHTGSKDLVHARYMRPVCRSIGSSKNSYVFMEHETAFESMTAYAKEAIEHSDTTSSDPKHPYQRLMQLYMSPLEAERTDPSNSPEWKRRQIHQLHIRRSLDQYYYHALLNTDLRDRDQLVSRLHEKSHTPEDKRVMMVVVQLWLWVLEEDTVFSSFTGRWSKGSRTDVSRDKTDVLDNITRDRFLVTYAHDLAGRIVHKCLTSCLDPVTNTEQSLHFLEFYITEIASLADKESKVFRAFKAAVSGNKHIQSTLGTLQRIFIREKDVDDSTISSAEVDPFGVAEETRMLERIKDIRDELHILEVLIGDRKTVIDQLYDFQNGGQYIQRAKRTVRQYGDQVKRMKEHATQTEQALSELLDQKNKSANVQQAKDTARQGKTLMVFTLVTTIFLPLSFMAAFFAIEIAEFPRGPNGLDLGWVSMYMFSISFAIVVPFVIFAFTINAISRWFESMFRKLKNMVYHALPASSETTSASNEATKLAAKGTLSPVQELSTPGEIARTADEPLVTPKKGDAFSDGEAGLHQAISRSRSRRNTPADEESTNGEPPLRS